MNNLRILLFNWRCPKHPEAGGAEKATYEISKRWVGWGHEVHLVTGCFPGGRINDCIDGIKITRLGGKYSVYPRTFLHYLFTLRGKYDIVIDEINTIPYFTNLYVKQPHVAIVHQLAANVLSEELPASQAKVLAFLEPRALRGYNKTHIFTSESTKTDLLRIGIPPENIHVINYGVNHNIYKPGCAKSSYPHVFYLGRLKKFKGVHLLIQAMAQVVKEIPEAKLSIIGDGDVDYETELKLLVTKLQLSEVVVFHKLGFRDSLEEKTRIMQNAWVSVFPSAREGFGLVVVEANACGTPTIATNVPGLRETVRNNETGILVDRNVDALAVAIKRVLNDNQLRERLSRQAVEWSVMFDWNRTALEMMNVMKKIVAEAN